MARLSALPTVQVRIITPALLRILEALAADIAPEHVVTSITDGVHNHDSAHYRGEAVDVRTRDLTPDAAAAFATRVVDALGGTFLVLLEQPGATPATSAQHLHIQLRPEAARQWTPDVRLSPVTDVSGS